MNKVIANQGAATVYQASLQEFKNAFQLKGTGFKTSVGSTRGVLYVKDGQLCSANRRGGRNEVSSSVTNLALRTALVNAFRDAGATAQFMTQIRRQLLGDEFKDKDLSRSEVKDLLIKFEKNRQSVSDMLDCQKKIGQLASDVRFGIEEKLEIDDFRRLSLGSGYVGGEVKSQRVVKLASEDGKEWVEFDQDENKKNAAYHASLRHRLYEVVRDAKDETNLPADQKCARELLLQHLKSTLIGSDLEKPLSCDEIRRTLTALDNNMGYVPPKALSDRTVKATGKKAELSDLCKRYEKDAERIDAFLSSHVARKMTDSGLTPEFADALRRLSSLRREMADVGRRYLRSGKVDVEAAKEEFAKIKDSFVRNYPTTLKLLANLRGFCSDGIRKVKSAYSLADGSEGAFGLIFNTNGQACDKVLPDFKKLLAALDLTGLGGENRVGLKDRMATERETIVGSEAGKYIDEVVNNAAEGDCLFYSVEDAQKDVLPGEGTQSDLAAANKLRSTLAQYMTACQGTIPRKDDPEGVGKVLRIPCAGCYLQPLESDLAEDLTKLANPGEIIDLNYVPFLATQLKRPIVVLGDVKRLTGADSPMLCCNRNVETGEKLQGEPIAIHFGNGHYQAVKLNQAGLDHYRELAKLAPDGKDEGLQVEEQANEIANEYVRENKATFDEKFKVLQDRIRPLKDFPVEIQDLLKEVLHRAVKGEVIAKGAVDYDGLWGEGSVFDSIRILLKNYNVSVCLDPQILQTALELPPEHLSAFFRACTLVQGGDRVGLAADIGRVAGRLATLPPDQFTAGNILRLARPDWILPKGMLSRDAQIEVKNLLHDLGENLRNEVGKETDTPSLESYEIVLQVLRRSFESVYAEKGVVTLEDLQTDGSVFDSVKKLTAEVPLSMSSLTFALSLPPKEARAYLKASQLVPFGDNFGTDRRLRSVASRLAELPPEKFTLKEILKRAFPGVTFSDALTGKMRLSGRGDLELLEKELCESGLLPKQDANGVTQVRNSAVAVRHQILAHVGMSLENVQAVLNDPTKFSLKMLPESAFLPRVIGSEKGVSDAFRTFAVDAPRNLPRVTILDANGTESHGENLRAEIEALCGRQNVVQQQFVVLFMTQNAMTPEELFGASFGNGANLRKNEQFRLKADPRTGDVYVTKTTNPDLDFGMSVTIRFGRDGSMSVVDLQERKVPGDFEQTDFVKLFKNADKLIDRMAGDILEVCRRAEEQYPNGMQEKDSFEFHSQVINRAQLAQYAELGQTRDEIVASLRKECMSVLREWDSVPAKTLKALLAKEYRTDAAEDVNGRLKDSIESSMTKFKVDPKQFGNNAVGLAHDFFRATDNGGMLTKATLNGKNLIDMRGDFDEDFKSRPEVSRKFGTENEPVKMKITSGDKSINVWTSKRGRVIQELMTSLPDNSEGYENTMLYLTTMLSLSNSTAVFTEPDMIDFDTGFGKSGVFGAAKHGIFGVTGPADEIETEIQIDREKNTVKVVQTKITQQADFGGFKTNVPHILVHPVKMTFEMSFPLKKDAESLDLEGHKLEYGKLPQGFTSKVTMTPIETGNGGLFAD